MTSDPFREATEQRKNSELPDDKIEDAARNELSGASMAERPSVRAMIVKSSRPRSSATARIIRSLPAISWAGTSALPPM